MWSVIQQLPTNGLACARYASSNAPDNQGIVVFVKITKWIEIFMKLVRDLNFRAADNLYAADTVEEAIQLIRDHTSQNA